MEERYDYMWNEYICGRLSVEKWLAFADKYYKKYLEDA